MKKLVDFCSRHQTRAFCLAVALLVVTLTTVFSASTSALTGLFAPSPASGSYTVGNQFNIAINFSNSGGTRNPLTITVAPSTNLQYLNAGFDNTTVTSHQVSVDANGSLRITVELASSKLNTPVVTIANLAFKAKTAGPASLVLSNGHSSGSGSRDRDAATQNGSYMLQSPAPPPAPAPSKPPVTPPSTTTPKPAPATTTPAPAAPGPVKSAQTDVLPILEKPAADTTTDSTSTDTTEPSSGSNDTSVAQPTKKTTAGTTKNLPWLAIAGGIAALGIIMLAIAASRRHKPLAPQQVTAENATAQDAWAKARRTNAIAQASNPLHTPPATQFPALNTVAPVAPLAPSVVLPPAPAAVLPVPPIQQQQPTPQPLAVPATPKVMPIPYATTAHPVPKNAVEAKIEETFYPLEATQHAKSVSQSEEPLDMFQMAQQYPKSFGNDLYVEPPQAPPAAHPSKPSPKSK